MERYNTGNLQMIKITIYYLNLTWCKAGIFLFEVLLYKRKHEHLLW